MALGDVDPDEGPDVTNQVTVKLWQKMFERLVWLYALSHLIVIFYSSLITHSNAMLIL
jgi:hypothetical protein